MGTHQTELSRLCQVLEVPGTDRPFLFYRSKMCERRTPESVVFHRQSEWEVGEGRESFTEPPGRVLAEEGKSGTQNLCKVRQACGSCDVGSGDLGGVSTS